MKKQAYNLNQQQDDDAAEKNYVISQMKSAKRRKSNSLKQIQQSESTGACIGQLALALSAIIFFIILVAITTLNFWQVANKGKPITDKKINIAFFAFCNKQKSIKSLQSFFKTNNYPYASFYALTKQNPTQEITQRFKGVSWLVVDEKQKYKLFSQIASYDGYEYLFKFDCDWQFINEGYIQDSVQLLTQFSRVSQILLHSPGQTISLYNTNQMIGFSLAPGLHRRQDLVNASIQFPIQKAQNSQQAIKNVQQRFSNYFLRKYMYALKTQNIYIQKIK